MKPLKGMVLLNNSVSLKELSPVISEVISSGGTVRVTAAGSSMHPVIKDGIDTVILCKCTNEIKKDDIVLFQRDNGRLVLHRVINSKGNDLTLRGDNQWITETVSADKVIASLDSIERNGRVYSADSFYFKKYKVLLPFIRWTRRIINSVKIRLGVSKK